MNTFADWLFSALFGWMGSVANGAWNALVNAGGGISSFFSKYWLIFLLAAIMIGTVLDYAVWLVRWRPYLVWRSWLTRRLRRRRMHRNAEDLANTDMDDHTRDTLAEWVSTPADHYPVQYEPLTYDQQQPVYDQNFFYDPALNYAQPEEQNYVVQPDHIDPFTYNQQPGGSHWQASQPAWQEYTEQQEPMPLSGYQNQPLIDYVQPPEQPYYASVYGDGQNVFNTAPSFDESDTYIPEDESYLQAEVPQNKELTPGRRRRSDRKPRPLTRRLFDNLRDRIGGGDDEEGMLDSLPSNVRPEDAFHEAVYPKGYRYQDSDGKGKEQ